jgi:hypothetical protein
MNKINLLDQCLSTIYSHRMDVMKNSVTALKCFVPFVFFVV